MNRFLVTIERNYGGDGANLRFSVKRLGDEQHGLPENVSISYSTIFLFIAELKANSTEEVLKELSILSSADSALNGFLVPKEWKIESLYYLGRIIIIDGLPYVVNPIHWIGCSGSRQGFLSN